VLSPAGQALGRDRGAQDLDQSRAAVLGQAEAGRRPGRAAAPRAGRAHRCRADRRPLPAGTGGGDPALARGERSISRWRVAGGEAFVARLVRLGPFPSRFVGHRVGAGVADFGDIIAGLLTRTEGGRALPARLRQAPPASVTQRTQRRHPEQSHRQTFLRLFALQRARTAKVQQTMSGLTGTTGAVSVGAMSSRKPISKAVFPVAGLGTRFLPATKAIPKELLPVVDRPLIQYAVDEAREAGIE